MTISRRKHTKQLYFIVTAVEVIKEYPRTVNRYYTAYWNKKKVL